MIDSKDEKLKRSTVIIQPNDVFISRVNVPWFLAKVVILNSVLIYYERILFFSSLISRLTILLKKAGFILLIIKILLHKILCWNILFKQRAFLSFQEMVTNFLKVWIPFWINWVKNVQARNEIWDLSQTRPMIRLLSRTITASTYYI